MWRRVGSCNSQECIAEHGHSLNDWLYLLTGRVNLCEVCEAVPAAASAGTGLAALLSGLVCIPAARPATGVARGGSEVLLDTAALLVHLPQQALLELPNSLLWYASRGGDEG